MNDEIFVGFDFDNTLTKRPEQLAMLAQQLAMNGDRPILVTARRQTEENEDIINEFLDKYGCQMPIIFTNLGSKLEAVKKRGIEIAFWIDDDPETLVHGR